MYKTGILNSDLSKILSDLGHTDEIVIADCGLPIPNGVKKIDLAVKKGLPSFIDVLTEVERHMVIEHVTFAEEVKQENKELHEEAYLTVRAYSADYKSHEAFKEQTKSAKAIIRTGEASPYANIILRSGVNF